MLRCVSSARLQILTDFACKKVNGRWSVKSADRRERPPFETLYFDGLALILINLDRDKKL